MFFFILGYVVRVIIDAYADCSIRTCVEQGAEDGVVPPSMGDFVQRDLPNAILHKLPYEGHFSYFYLCNECHRQVFTTVFGNPQGPLAGNENRARVGDKAEGNSEAACSDAATKEENVCALAVKDDELR